MRENATATDVAHGFLDNVWKLHGLPQEIISDRDIKFTGEFWMALCKLLKIKSSKSSAYYPQTDGQTERINQVLEGYRQNFVNSDQDDRYYLLLLAESVYNNLEALVTKLTTYFPNYGLHLRTTWAIDGDTKNPASKLYTHCMQRIMDYSQENLKNTWINMARYLDKRHLPEPKFKVGDLVMLDARNIKSKRPSRKLAPKSYGLFPFI